MTTTLENLQAMVDVNTVVGSPVFTDGGTIIIPISKVGFGYVAGGGEYGEIVSKGAKNDSEMPKFPFAGGSGAGVSVSPTGFLVIINNTVKYLPVQQRETLDRILEALPQLIKEVKETFSDCIQSSDTEDTDEFMDDIE